MTWNNLTPDFTKKLKRDKKGNNLLRILTLDEAPESEYTQEQITSLSWVLVKPFSDISFTRQSARERKKTSLTTPRKIMTDNQNINKTSMKHVQQQHFLFKTASWVTEMFPKPLLSLC